MILSAGFAVLVQGLILQGSVGTSPGSVGLPTDELIALMLQSLPGESALWRDATDWIGEVGFLETGFPADSGMTVSEAVSPDSSYRSMVFRDRELNQERLFIEETGTGRRFALEWPQRLPWRPVSGLLWVSDSLLVFTQWSQPGFGYCYAVDVPGQRLVLALALSGE